MAYWYAYKGDKWYKRHVKRRKNYAYRDFKDTIKKHGFDPNIYKYIDESRLDYMAQLKGEWDVDNDSVGVLEVFKDPMFYLCLVALVITIICPPAAEASWMVWAAWGLSLAGSGVSLALSVYDNAVSYPKAQAAQQEIKHNALKGSASKKALQDKQASDKITHLLIYSPYKMCANNEVYKAQAAGSESFSASIAYDPNKGFLGSHFTNEVDEMIQNRSHIARAGNIGYDMLENGLPKASFNLSLEARNDVSENHLRITTQAVGDLFNELFNEGYGIKDASGAISDYDKALNGETRIFKQQIITDRFLDSLKNYNRAIKADFFYTQMKDFIPKRLTPEQVQESLKNLKEDMENILNDPNAAPDTKAQSYFNYIEAAMLGFRAKYGEREFKNTDKINIAYIGTSFSEYKIWNAETWEFYYKSDGIKGIAQTYYAGECYKFGLTLEKGFDMLSEIEDENLKPSEIVALYTTFLGNFASDIPTARFGEIHNGTISILCHAPAKMSEYWYKIRDFRKDRIVFGNIQGDQFGDITLGSILEDTALYYPIEAKDYESYHITLPAVLQHYDWSKLDTLYSEL